MVYLSTEGFYREPEGVVITFSNITAAKTLEAQLQQTQSETKKRVE